MENYFIQFKVYETEEKYRDRHGNRYAGEEVNDIISLEAGQSLAVTVTRSMGILQEDNYHVKLVTAYKL